MTKQDDKDQRRVQRVEVNHEFASVGEFVREYALNLSTHGVFIRTAEVVPVGTIVRLRFSVIADHLEMIEGEGRVVRAVEPEDSEVPGVGVVFTKLTPESEGVLAKLFVRTDLERQ